jgi:hypothetical protein
MMSRACGTHEKQNRCIQDFGGVHLKERGHLEDVSVDGV